MAATEVLEPTDTAARCRHVESEAHGWSCVWLPRHGLFLAYPDTAVYPNGSRPTAVAEPTAEKTLTAIRATGQLRDLVRGWLALNEGTEHADTNHATVEAAESAPSVPPLPG